MSAHSAKLLRYMAADATARRLTERLDALAAALRAAGVSPEQSAARLASAATATMHAVTLDVLHEGEPQPAPAVAAPVREPLQLAA
jgi:non-ribosomal peptide synthetase component F